MGIGAGSLWGAGGTGQCCAHAVPSHQPHSTGQCWLLHTGQGRERPQSSPSTIHPLCPASATSLPQCWCHEMLPGYQQHHSPSYPTAPINPIHPRARSLPWGCHGPGGVGSDTRVAGCWGHHHPQQQRASRHFPPPVGPGWGPVPSAAPLLAPDIQGIPALCHQFLYIVHGLGLAHVPKLGHDLVEGVLHIPGHVASIAGSKGTMREASDPLSPPDTQTGTVPPQPIALPWTRTV